MALYGLACPNGVDRDLLMMFRFSPLHCAAVYNNFATVELLLRSNADASLQDDEGRTAQDCAREFAQAEDLFMAAVEVRSECGCIPKAHECCYVQCSRRPQLVKRRK